MADRTRTVTVALALIIAGTVTSACTIGGRFGAGSGAPPAAASGAPTDANSPGPAASHPPTAPVTPATAAATTRSPAPHPPVAEPLTCGQLASAEVGSATLSYNGYHDGIPLGGTGRWSGEDGAQVDLRPQCGIGDLDGDGAADAVGVVSLTTGGSGDFYTLVVWRNAHGAPVCQALADLGDRNPVVSIAVHSQRATVVYLTRGESDPMAAVTIKRTAIYRLSGSHFTEVSHTDQPYAP